MVGIVGPKGQVVISKSIRDRLGIQPGWKALQRMVDDHVEVYFIPPEHTKSLKGSLANYIKDHFAPGKEWDKAREKAWKHAVRGRTDIGEQPE